MKTKCALPLKATFAMLLLLGLVAMFTSSAAWAHFQLNANTRIIHVEHVRDGLRVYMRLPMPYVVAGLVGEKDDTGLPRAAPYTTNALENGTVAYYLDVDAFQRDPIGLGALVADGHQFVVEGQDLSSSVQSVRVYPRSVQPLFATIEDARQAFAGTYPLQDYPPTYAGDAVVDVVLLLTGQGNPASYAISSSLDPGLEGQDKTANLILDYYPGSVKVHRARGLLDEAINITRSPWSAALTFVKEGVRHILEGLDHVLFVVCLALGASTFKSLIARATGFTIGHSITLSIGFFGQVPTGAWFIPAIELGIAGTIIFAALAAVVHQQRREIPERTMFLITAVIGTLHGLGFSYVLHKILQVDSPNIWQSLLSFNVGVEIGQVLIVLACWPAFRLVSYLGQQQQLVARSLIAFPCVLIASAWVMERTILLFQSV